MADFLLSRRPIRFSTAIRAMLGAGLLFSSAAAQTLPTTLPATAPATQPATSQPASRLAVLLDTPQAALKHLAIGMADGDADRLLAVIFTYGDEDRRFVTAMAGFASAGERLRLAAATAYGPMAAKPFGDDPQQQLAAALADIDRAAVIVSGATATVRLNGPGGESSRVVLRNGHWRVPLDQFTRDLANGDISQAAADLESLANAATVVAAEISSGHHKTAESAHQAWRSRIATAMSTPRPAKP